MSELSDPTELPSPYAFAETVDRLTRRLADAGMTLFASIDHRAGALSVGLEMPPATVIVFGNPRAGTPLMVAAPRLALDLPLRVLVRETADGKVLVAYHPAQALTRAAGLADEAAATLARAEGLIAGALA